ncbi:CPBP family intramembrane metalloprotease [Aureibaculum sp. A20]|uniref:CPBP family intramembrane metalloprotease n=1 Tax=Aureibaculum flavum TaxID=2795986 RepID=A0ABS0WLZ4_9FLAO|nr:type II CAAX endopeptidase family protein [Aureibaculum flavum]MBJ2172986.1 CPBP family intramembrane metalloprotease [Aureibaculum flavum]
MNFIQQAYKGRNEWWMYVLTFVSIFVGIQFASIPLMITGYFAVDGDMDMFRKEALDNFMKAGIDNNLFLGLMIFTFIVALFILYLFVRFLHKRSFKSLITSRFEIDWKRFWFAFILWGGIVLIMSLVGVYLSPDDFVWNFKPIPFFTLLLVSFLLLPFQTSAEELVFRGYLMQGLGVLAKNRWFPLIVTSTAFGLLHGMNPEVEKLGFGIMVFYIGTGFFYGISTLMDEGTELALGLHASNNIIAAFLITTNWSVFQTDALYLDTSEPSLGLNTYLPVFVIYPIMLFIFSRKYGWKNWKEKLFGKVEEPIIID